MTDKHLLRLDAFMSQANSLYYAKKDPFSDFTTAPEISQVFGELIAAWVIAVWQMMPSDSAVALVEMGPGRGTFMSDILRVIKKCCPSFYKNCNVFFIETSPRLRKIQQHNLMQNHSVQMDWFNSFSDIPSQPIILFANEFLDALPIRQFIKRSAGQWAERYVKQKQFVAKPVEDLPNSPVFKRAIQKGNIVEVSENSQNIIDEISRFLCANFGAALFMDYGYCQPLWGDTLQAIYKGEKTFPLAFFGKADLTSHVDFLTLGTIAVKAGAKLHPFLTQGDFLQRLGIMYRLEALSSHCSTEQKQSLLQDVRRLITPEEMGQLFKVMAISHPSLHALPAFESIED
ncbi:hypothetical protein COMNV_00677 [Commensalibacter sp. Nvir]|uniref:class I SAM-dependent methyltransferase n=1 Tax=Commensalibacter sp. Nvir TaxID=3069817 RepID=UPI002D5D9F4D|nr:hypothetical protein COMNV_00677 [Commensalibacter sp. Nvir]